MKVSHAFAFALLLLSSACGSQRINICEADADCTNPAYPFCDVSGQYPAAEGETNVCTIVPANCPAERCGCTPNATTCSDGTLSVCNADGKSTTDTGCDLGCSPDATRCGTFAPSNGLADALEMAALESDVELGGVLIDNAGTISTIPAGSLISVRSIVVQQPGVPAVRVYLAHSFKIHGATLIPSGLANRSPIAFVATGPITVDGLVDAGFPYGAIRLFGPGGQPDTAPCAGQGDAVSGGAGGGNGTAGGDGAPTYSIPPTHGTNGGPAQPNGYVPLVGGCQGGDDGNGNPGGSGGAALQFVSMSSITVAEGGIINIGGEGGVSSAGGGAGGNALFEAPTITINGSVTANGGSGGACGTSGNNGPTNATAAASVGGCGVVTLFAFSGTGGTKDTPPGAASSSNSSGGGGGGSVGRLGLNTSDGTFTQGAQTVLSAEVTTSTLVKQ
jgi:hypothetical protein